MAAASRPWSAICYLGGYQMLPCDRTGQFFDDLFNSPMSAGTASNILMKLGRHTQPSVARIDEALRKAPLIHGDETGASIGGRTQWLHVACTSLLSRFGFHPKRGKEGMDAMGILPGYQANVVHDFLSSYYGYEHCVHNLCNAHHLRDLKFVHETLGQGWAKQMIELLLEAKQLREDHDARGREIPQEATLILLGRYHGILALGYDINPEPEKIEGKKGRPKRGKALNLLDRFRDREEEVMGFFLHKSIPFDNNQAERDLRVIKAKLKISGCFRSPDAATAFADLRSVIATARKASLPILDTLTRMLQSPDQLAMDLVPGVLGT